VIFTVMWSAGLALAGQQVGALGWALYAPAMELPAGYRLRAPAPGDLDAVAEVLIADELGEAGQIVLGTDFVRDEWERGNTRGS
jgi:hypothetical protein